MNFTKLGMTVVTMLAITATSTCFAVSKQFVLSEGKDAKERKVMSIAMRVKS